MTSRRSFLKSASFGAGTLLLSPLMNQLQMQAAGSKEMGKRFVFVLEGNGLHPQQITPTNITRGGEGTRTALIDKPLKELTLPKALEPLQPWKDKVTILQGLSGRVAGGGHSTDFSCLGQFGRSVAPKGETIDAALAKKLGGIFPHVGLGIVNKGGNTVVYNCSAWDKGKALPTQLRPDLAYGNLFGSAAGGSAKQEFMARTNVLDFLLDDIKTLEKQVSGAEKEKLDQHLQAYEALRNRQSRLNEIESTLKAKSPQMDNKYKSQKVEDQLDAHFDLAAASLIGGLTNVVTLSSGVGGRYFDVRFAGLGIESSKHRIGHEENSNGPRATTIRRFHFELIARLMKKLEGVKEGNGTMLDNTVFLYLSDAPDQHHSRGLEWPCVVIGDLGGKLKTGRYLEYPYFGKKGHREMGNLYNTFLSLAGDNRDFFGTKDPMLKDLNQKGTLKELLS